MTAPTDLIRREDVLAIVFPDACSEARKGALCLHPSCDAVRFSPILDALRSLPADPVAETSVRLAELLMSDLDERESMGPAAWDAALTAYRAAVAARDGKEKP